MTILPLASRLNGGRGGGEKAHLFKSRVRAYVEEMQLKRAETLLEIRNTLLAGHLENADQLRQFYRKELQELRGFDFVTAFVRDLREDVAASGPRYFHKFVSGHPGVGKSTELSRLELGVTGEFETIRLNAQQELNPAFFDPRDLIIVLIKASLHRTIACLGKKKGPADADEALKAALEWVEETKVVTKTKKTKAASGKAGLGPGAESWWGKAFGIFASVQGEARYETEEDATRVAYRLKPISELLQHANAVFAACVEACGRPFLFVIDNFEKPDFDSDRIRKLFVQNGSLLGALQVHFVCTMPIERANTEDIRRLQPYDSNIQVIPDAPVFGRDSMPHLQGRKALRSVLESRVTPELFGVGQIDRLVVASGGNIRDLFSLIVSARNYALNVDEEAMRLEAADVTPAINGMRADYQRKLYGDDVEGKGGATYKAKLDLLTDFFFQRAEAERGPTFYSLLRARALQEFGDARIGVHPLIVDLLFTEGRLSKVEDHRREPAAGKPYGCTI